MTISVSCITLFGCSQVGIALNCEIICEVFFQIKRGVKQFGGMYSFTAILIALVTAMVSAALRAAGVTAIAVFMVVMAAPYVGVISQSSV